MLQALDATAVRQWCAAGLDALGRARDMIDSLNVFPVPDGDTGTNLYLTLEAAVEAMAPVDGAEVSDDLGDTVGALAHGAMLGARGNSGVILAQLLRGLADILAAASAPASGATVQEALGRASDLAYAAVARPVEGTVLSVARAAAEAAREVEHDLATVVSAAAHGAREALARTPDQLEVLRQAQVVDAGGQGLVVLLDALVAVVTGVAPPPLPVPPGSRSALTTSHLADEEAEGPEYEVMYLLEAPESSVHGLRGRLGELGDSLVVIGSDGLWNVHVHVDDAGAAIEAGMVAGRPFRIVVTALALSGRRPTTGTRAVVAVVPGAGFSAVLDTAGVTTVLGGPGRRPSTRALLEAVTSTGAAEVVLLPNDADSLTVAETAAAQARQEGVRVAVVPTHAPVQALAAVAVHDPARPFDDDVVSMTAAANATRHGGVTVAVRDAMTSAGVCAPGDVLGLIDDDVAVIGSDVTEVAVEVVDRMLAGGGELVTLVPGGDSPAGLVEAVTAHLRQVRLDVEVVAHDGGQQLYPLLLGVE